MNLSHTLKHILPLVLLFSVTAPAYALWPFSKSEEELQAEAAIRVAELLRKPKGTMAQAQIAIEEGDLEGAIQLYRQAISEFNDIERTEDTSGSIFSELRIKKFHCSSMLDALILRRSEVMDVRRAVSDTSELEARLAQEREALKKENQKKSSQKKSTAATNETISNVHEKLLKEEEQKLALARQEVQKIKHKMVLAQKTFNESQAAFDALAKQHTEADSNAFLAQRNYRQISSDENASKKDIASAKQIADNATAYAKQVKTELEKIRAELKASEEALEQTEIEQINANENLKRISWQVENRRELAQKEAEKQRLAKKAAEEEARKSQEAINLLKKQKEAEENIRFAKEQEEKKLQADAISRAEAEKLRQRLELELDLCEDLWKSKDIDELERRLMTNCEQWPNEHIFLIYLARIRLLQERVDDALDLVGLIPESGQTGLQARLIAAAVYLKKNQPEEAKKVLEQAMKDAPNAPEPYFNMAITLLRLPRLDPNRDISAKYYTRSVELGGKRSFLLERRLEMKEAETK
jgi:hypothetical protein